MDQIIDYLNNNALVTSLCTLFLSELCAIITVIVDRRIERKNKERDDKKEEFRNKGELRVDKTKKTKHCDRINIIYSSYKKSGEEYIINKEIMSYEKVDYIYLPLTNIGKVPIKEMYITVNDRNCKFIVEEERIKSLIKNKYLNYVVPYYNKILPNETILMQLSFMEKDKIFKSFSSELTIYFCDEYGNFYKQPIFLKEDRIEGPYKVDEKLYMKETYLSPE